MLRSSRKDGGKRQLVQVGVFAFSVRQPGGSKRLAIRPGFRGLDDAPGFAHGQPEIFLKKFSLAHRVRLASFPSAGLPRDARMSDFHPPALCYELSKPPVDLRQATGGTRRK